MEIMFQIKKTGKMPRAGEIFDIFSILLEKDETAHICRDLFDFDMCNYVLVELSEGVAFFAIEPTEKGKEAFGYLSEEWEKYRELILAGMDARKILLAELELNHTNVTEEELIRRFNNVLSPEEIKDIIKNATIEGLFQNVAGRLILSNQKYVTKKERDIWSRCRENLLQEGF